MAANNKGKKTSSLGQSSTRGKTNTNAGKGYSEQDSALFHEVVLILLFAAAVILFLCNFGVLGTVGNGISSVLFGLFGTLAYVAAIAAFLGAAFWSANGGSPAATRKIAAGIILFLMAGVICELISGYALHMESYSLAELYKYDSEARRGGGIIAGSIAYLCYHFLDTLGTVLVVIILSLISLVLLTERSLVNSMKNGGRRVAELSREDAERRREQARLRRSDIEEERQRREEERAKRLEEKRLKAEEKENEKILRMDKKVSGVMADTTLTPVQEKRVRDDMHEIILNAEEDYIEPEPEMSQMHEIRISGVVPEPEEVPTMEEVFYREEEIGSASWEEDYQQEEPQEPVVVSPVATQPVKTPAAEPAAIRRPVAKLPEKPKESSQDMMTPENASVSGKLPGKYIFPPLSRLQKGKGGGGDSAKELKETAMRLQQTLATFGVKVTITDISQGPSVTRYELQPEQGVKVSKIVGLSDDIKLNLAATDIRIEAPIPGKAAIGIEVPNKENMAVALRDLLETNEFKEFPSNLAFAVGKDIAGKVVVADIAKMPHMLIAGATGSGKSVCINTLIMSILYKAHPDDVKLIMVDPKVVELSVYNGIPHLLIPVVTDPKKAAAALHWGVSEMTDRYKKFADFNVRDLKGYNQKVESLRESGDETLSKLPQIVIIVDELADLMMVSPGEVEESICRLAQLARAAGIHLIIATQRPSVDVITGLIKANMPSRVAFSVSSGVDSRTILDMNGAEKLLGKGDMLFYPQGYSKPARVQGAFVSDREVSDVVDFLKNQAIGNVYAADVEEKIQNMGGSGQGGAAGSDGAGALDEYFADAGRFIIDKDKASIGMLQRMFKIGFNRAARIMDQLSEYGVVGEEEGTKPRKVLMSMTEFEQLLEEI